ncbi:hypothetical protein CBR_g5719 [Chara braunii]|uniref:Prolyl 4-hydroxylase alpha subunit domain-containing protein n=1 Tax=Chara braunii TaxID=69332 RepID=A0A388KJ82_CHABU|nr:hypothetical protein CBR_g5719 [Chara braunii]|eukprot:GBG70087.1 hypothetical protein CBR_g5719 [Chara braunii]
MAMVERRGVSWRERPACLWKQRGEEEEEEEEGEEEGIDAKEMGRCRGWSATRSVISCHRWCIAYSILGMLGVAVLGKLRSVEASGGQPDDFPGWLGERHIVSGRKHLLRGASDGTSGFDSGRVITLSWEPRVFLYKGFLTNEECDHLVNQARDKLEKSMVADNESGKSVKSQIRTSSGMFMRKAQAKQATDALARLDKKKYKNAHELTNAVEKLIVVPSERYDPPKVLPTMYLRYLPTDIKNMLVSEANIEVDDLASFSKKALDLHVELGCAQQVAVDGRKKKITQDWKKKGTRLMMIDSDANQVEIDDISVLVEETKLGGEERVEGGNLTAATKEGKSFMP